MTILRNDFLEVELNAKGAEIINIIGQEDQINYMWKRDPILWSSSAPILFPIVGALRDNHYRINGETYTMSQHGFSRHCVYETHQCDDSCVEFHLTSNAESLKQYPYVFDLKVVYTLKNNQLICHCTVTNADQHDIYFQIGGHPAFACPFYENESSNDYFIEFEKNETLNHKIIDVPNHAMSYETKPFFDNEKRFFIRQALFDNDAIVFKNFQSEWISIKSLNHHKSIKFYMKNYEHVGLWASHHVGGLLAIEPWVGHNDYVGFTGDFKEKESVVCLESGKTFDCEFTIEINQ